MGVGIMATLTTIHACRGLATDEVEPTAHPASASRPLTAIDMLTSRDPDDGLYAGRPKSEKRNPYVWHENLPDMMFATT